MKTQINQSTFLQPEWPAPDVVNAFVTTRRNPINNDSLISAFGNFNLADHVNDSYDAVQNNRALLSDTLQLPSEPCWLKQVHGVTVVEAKQNNIGKLADASYSNQAGSVCAILTADCLPILLADADGQWVAAIHAGWRGLHAGVIEHTVAQFKRPANCLMAWLGPAIGPQSYEIGEEVHSAFTSKDPELEFAFQQTQETRWMMDLYAVAKYFLLNCGIADIYGGGYCTYKAREEFYSYRRDGCTGRMASLIWINSL